MLPNPAKDIDELGKAIGPAQLLAVLETAANPLAAESVKRDGALVGLRGVTLTESDLDSLEITKRRPLLGNWFCESDLGFICGKRGGGKTWLALLMARALAEGRACGPWAAHGAVKVLYIDGEMPLDEMRERNQALRGEVGENLSFLSHQVVFDRAERNLCLSNSTQQDAVTRLCEEEAHKVVFLDNQSTLITRVRENSADDWRDMIEGWLLGLRRRRIAVVIINHAGRNGEMRGTSKREDSAFWQIVLDPAEKQGEGARFLSRFTKNRNAPEDPTPLNWHFRPAGERVIPTFSEADPLQIFRGWLEDGLARCADIAEEMGVSKGYVSKLAKRAEQAGWLRNDKREYRIIGAD